jgi:carboxyl-terminal processing protease
MEMVSRIAVVCLLAVAAWLPTSAMGLAGRDDRASPEEVIRDAERAIRAQYWDVEARARLGRGPEGPAYANRAVAYDAIRGMISQLNDPSTRFLMPHQADALMRDLEEPGSAALGLAEVLHLDVDLRSRVIIVIAPVPGSPAAEAGLRTGDVVEAVDGLETDGLAVHEVAALIRRGNGDVLVLRIDRAGKRQEVRVDRAHRWAPPPAAEYRRVEVAGRPLGVLGIHAVTRDAVGVCRDAAAAFAEWKVSAIVVDLRGNAGGQVDALAEVAGMFLGDATVARMVDRRGELIREWKSTGPRTMPRVPTAVLCDEGTASAAELLAACLREQAAAPIIGRPSLGKTLVHTLHRLPDRSALFLTLGEMRTGAGAEILRVGLRPDVDAGETRDIDRLIAMAAESLHLL